MSSRMRWTARVGVAALAVGIAAPAAWAASTWTPAPGASKTTGVASAQYSWNYGSSFAKRSGGGLALAYTSDAGTASSDQSTYVRLGTVAADNTVTWDKAKLTSPKTMVADRTSLAAGSNNSVHAVYVKQNSYANYDPAEPRVAYVRSLVGGTWQAPVRLSPTSGRVDYPIASAVGTNVYIAYTNSDTGAVLMRRSTNSGGSYGSVNLGTTTRDDGEGLAAWPITCASGTNVAAVWMDGTGDAKLSVSENSGTSYTTKTINADNVGGNDEGWASCDATGTRIGITFNEDDGVHYTEYNTSSDTFTTPLKNAFPFSGSGFAASYSGTVALSGAGTVGLAMPLCVQDGCDYETNSTRISLRWLESSNNGGAFAAVESISNASSALSGGKTLNDSPTALFYDADTRFVLYNGWTANYGNYRLYLAHGES